MSVVLDALGAHEELHRKLTAVNQAGQSVKVMIGTSTYYVRVAHVTERTSGDRSRHGTR